MCTAIAGRDGSSLKCFTYRQQVYGHKINLRGCELMERRRRLICFHFFGHVSNPRFCEILDDLKSNHVTGLEGKCLFGETVKNSDI